jgi:hypothetical protein
MKVIQDSQLRSVRFFCITSLTFFFIISRSSAGTSVSLARPGAVVPTVPVRFQYPSGVQALNLESYQAAVARQGEDMITTRVWWDVD